MDDLLYEATRFDSLYNFEDGHDKCVNGATIGILQRYSSRKQIHSIPCSKIFIEAIVDLVPSKLTARLDLGAMLSFIDSPSRYV